MEKARFDVFPLPEVLEDPLGRLFGKPALSCAA
jgi:hypothetical protein